MNNLNDYTDIIEFITAIVLLYLATYGNKKNA